MCTHTAHTHAHTHIHTHTQDTEHLLCARPYAGHWGAEENEVWTLLGRRQHLAASDSIVILQVMQRNPGSRLEGNPWSKVQESREWAESPWVLRDGGSGQRPRVE